MMIAESLLQKLASLILKKSHILDPSGIWSNFKAPRTYDDSRVSTADTCFLNSKKVSHSMLYVFVEFQTLQIVQLWYQTLKPLFAFVPYFWLEIARATKKRGECVKLDVNWSEEVCYCVTQLKLDTGEKLSSSIFCCLSGIGVTRPNLHFFQYIQAYKPFVDPVPPNTK